MGNRSGAALVNSDYEFQLYKDILSPAMVKGFAPRRKELEFMFFFMNKNPDATLANQQAYAQDYLDYLRSVGAIVPQFAPETLSYNWFGPLKNLSLERKLNSKIYGYQMLEELGLYNLPFHIVDSKEEVKKVLSDASGFAWILKSPYLMSGFDFHTVKSADDITALRHSYIMEPLFDRVLDLACFFDPSANERRFYFNHARPDGFYTGGGIFENDQDLESWILEAGFENVFQRLKEATRKITARLIKTGANHVCSMDSFVFKWNGKIEINPMCDLNYRQNMGALLNSLRDYLPPGGYGELVLGLSPGQAGHLLPYNPREKRGVIRLTPKSNEVQAFFAAGQSLAEAKKYLNLLFRRG